MQTMLVAVRRMACSWAGVETDEEAGVPAWTRDDGDSGRECVRGSMNQG